MHDALCLRVCHLREKIGTHSFTNSAEVEQSAASRQVRKPYREKSTLNFLSIRRGRNARYGRLCRTASASETLKSLIASLISLQMKSILCAAFKMLVKDIIISKFIRNKDSEGPLKTGKVTFEPIEGNGESQCSRCANYCIAERKYLKKKMAETSQSKRIPQHVLNS